MMGSPSSQGVEGLRSTFQRMCAKSWWTWKLDWFPKTTVLLQSWGRKNGTNYGHSRISSVPRCGPPDGRLHRFLFLSWFRKCFSGRGVVEVTTHAMAAHKSPSHSLKARNNFFILRGWQASTVCIVHPRNAEIGINSLRGSICICKQSNTKSVLIRIRLRSSVSSRRWR